MFIKQRHSNRRLPNKIMNMNFIDLYKSILNIFRKPLREGTFLIENIIISISYIKKNERIKMFQRKNVRRNSFEL